MNDINFEQRTILDLNSPCLAIVGFGKMGQAYHRLFSASLIVDPELSNNITANQSIASDIKIETELDSLKNSATLFDFVLLASPTPSHYEIAAKLIDWNFNLLIEKPLCLSSAHAQELEQAARSQKTLLFQSVLERYNPAIKFLKRNILASEVRNVKSFRFGPQPPKHSGENPIFDLAIHDVDLSWHLFKHQVPWRVSVGYGEARREVIVHLNNGSCIILDLLHRCVTLNSQRLTMQCDPQTNAIVEMLRDILLMSSCKNECWSDELKILETAEETSFDIPVM